MNARCLSLLAALAWPAGLATAAAPDPNSNYEAACYELALPGESTVVHLNNREGKVGERDFRPKVGDQRLGYTWFDYTQGSQWRDGQPGRRGWFRAVGEGTTPFWEDGNGDRAPQDAETAAVPYALWFQVESRVNLNTVGEMREAGDLPGPNGVFPPAMQFVEKQYAGQLGEPVAGVGDAAWFLIEGTSSNQWHRLLVVRGPAIVEFRGQVAVTLRTGVGTDLPKIQRGWIQCGDLRAQQMTQGSSSGYLEIGSIAGRTEPRLCEELTQMAREFVRGWDAFMAAKIGPGPHLKGYFASAAELAPTGADLPGSKLDQPSLALFFASGKLLNPRDPDSESVSFEIRTWNPSTNAATADEPMKQAQFDFRQRRDGYAKQPNMTATAPKVAGLDEVSIFQMSASNATGPIYTTQMAVFRVANVMGTVNYFRGDQALRMKGVTSLEDPTMTVLRAIGARAMKQERSAAKGEPTLQIAVTPAQLWSDGSATAELRIEAKNADGSALAAAPVEVAVSDPLIGELTIAGAVTDASGVAQVSYRAGRRPGTNTITAHAGGLTAKTEVRQGGLETVVRTPGFQFLCDGATPVEIGARVVGADGQALNDVAIDLQADESELPERGAVAAREDANGAQGWKAFAYTPPLVAPESGWRGGRVTLVLASAAQTTGAPALTATVPLTLHSGTAFWAVISKPGFAPSERVSFRTERRNGTVAGSALAKTPGGDVALAGATVVVSASEAGRERVVGRGETMADGTFAVAFALEQMSGEESTAQIVVPPLAIAAETQRWLDQARKAAEALKAKDHPSGAAETFLMAFATDLAASNADPRNPRNTARLVTAARLMAEALGYIDELDDQHTQAMGWLLASLDAAVEDLAKVAGIGEKVKGAQEGLATFYAANPSLAPLRERVDSTWASLQRRVLVRFLTTAYGVMEKAYTANAAAVDAADEDDKSDVLAWRKWAKTRADEKLFANWAFDPAGSAGQALEEKFKTELRAFLQRSYLGDYPRLVEAALAHAAGRIARGESTWENPERAAAVLRADFAAQAAVYTRANEAHLNRELTRLNLKFASDTVGKGAALYFSAKEAIRGDPAEVAKKIEASLDRVDQAFAAFDAAYQTYNGQQWFAVCQRARLNLAAVAVDAAR